MQEQVYVEGVRFARKVVEEVLEGKELEELLKEAAQKFPHEPRGIFTSIHTYPDHELRGCIGIPEPVYPFYKALVLSAYWAAFEDSRFPPLCKEELDNVVFEVSYLTPPKLLRVKDPREYLQLIKIGQHGIIIERGPYRALFLPQVAVEQNWSVAEFLSYCCLKAGLEPGCWLDKDTKVYVFEAEVYAEEAPRGKIIRKRLVYRNSVP
ncbi:MAG: TIGR00296 family protein [bacterium]|nr:TIGR00296 family protein [bacterium]